MRFTQIKILVAGQILHFHHEHGQNLSISTCKPIKFALLFKNVNKGVQNRKNVQIFNFHCVILSKRQQLLFVFLKPFCYIKIASGMRLRVRPTVADSMAHTLSYTATGLNKCGFIFASVYLELKSGTSMI